MKKVLGVFLRLIALVIVAVVGVVAFSNTSAGPLSDAAQGVKAAAANTILEASDVKGKVKSTIDTNRDNIAAATGLTADQVDAAIANLNIDSWEATPLPNNAVETGTVSGNYAGVDGAITTYSDPSYVTVSAYGQTITMAVPESAQEYLPYLALAQ